MKQSETTRRVFRRRAVQLEVRIRFKPAASFTKTGEPERLALMGRTRDISETGMALLVSARNIDRYLTRKENGFDVELRLPEGAIALQASPVYFKKIPAGGSATYLIGCRFTAVQDAQISRLITFLRTLPVGKVKPE
ncbi:MAG TPA: PilZ domain-containing protein [Pyrinomonadaceae bacterium]